QEVAIPFHTRYYQTMKQRLGDWMTAYYAQNVETVRRFIAKYHPDVLVLNTRDFEEHTLSRLNVFYSGISSQSWLHQNVPLKNVASDHANRSTLLRIKPSCRTFEQGPYIVIPSQAFYQAQCLSP